MGKGLVHEEQYSENKSLRNKEAQKYRTDYQDKGIEGNTETRKMAKRSLVNLTCKGTLLPQQQW